MVLVLIIISIALIIGGFAIYNENDDAGYAMILIGFLLLAIFVFVGLSYAKPLIAVRDVDERIAMYEEQNAEIESQVETAVKLYMSHEDEVFESASPDDYISLVSLYPELKSDTLMQKQMEVYVENNKKICELKEEKITAQRSKFWLYFGK